MAIAYAEQNIRKRLTLRAGHEFDKPQRFIDPGPVPMNVDLYRRQIFCTKCRKYGHVVRD
jgi:hypothetical protein